MNAQPITEMMTIDDCMVCDRCGTHAMMLHNGLCYECEADDDGDGICSSCNGSGEGMADGTKCRTCCGGGSRRKRENLDADLDD
jgi:hypothetical protein